MSELAELTKEYFSKLREAVEKYKERPEIKGNTYLLGLLDKMLGEVRRAIDMPLTWGFCALQTAGIISKEEHSKFGSELFDQRKKI
jgi:hypothetical protein